MLAAFGASPFALNLMPFNALAASTQGYRALVCVFLFGGMDNHDTVLPYDEASYAQFASVRQSLMSQYAGLPGGSSRDRARLLPLNATNGADFPGLQYALPEALAPIRDLFNSGKAAIVANAGPLIEPLDRARYSSNARRPARLFSHNDQQSTWMASAPEGARFGWGGRMGDMAIASSANANASFTAVSASGATVFLVGQTAATFPVGSGGPVQINAITASNLYGSAQAPGLLAQQVQDAGNTRANLFERDVATVYRQSIGLNRDLTVALSSQAPLATPFPANNGLASQLQIVARIIAARNTLGMKRQIFFVSTGGYDTHATQAQALTGLHTTLANALRAFYDATVELGVANDVTAFTASDFGRTLIVNGDGTDHGWGAHHFVIGGSVNGGRILGRMPPPAVNHSQDSGQGRLIPVVSVEQYAAGLGRWFGLTDGELRDALPGIVNFPGPIDLFAPGSIV
jgi:uncharacterized protein (DUF1501 family)